MEKLLALVLLLSCLTLDAQRTQTQVEWSETDKLHWSDFNGKAKKNHGPDALTHVVMGYEFETLGFNHFVFKLNMTFERNKSWVKSDHKNARLLAHEQLHFDIHEIYARKFMMYAHQEGAFDDGDFSKKLERVFNKTFRELKKMQEAYDHETNHSRNREAQAVWDKKVAKLLEETQKWNKRTFEFKV